MIFSTKIFGFSIARRRVRRALVVGYWCLLLLLCYGFLLHQAHHGVENMDLGHLFLIFIGLFALLGGVRVGGIVKPFRGVHWVPLPESDDVQTLLTPPRTSAFFEGTSLDEREANERDRIHFIAYTLARWLALLLFVAYGLLGLLHVAWFNRIGPFFLFLLTLTLWSLPQTLILWTEPDMEEPQ